MCEIKGKSSQPTSLLHHAAARQSFNFKCFNSCPFNIIPSITIPFHHTTEASNSSPTTLCHQQWTSQRRIRYDSTNCLMILQTQSSTNHIQALIFGVAAIIAGFTVYKIWGSDIFPSSVAPSSSASKSGGYAAAAPKQSAYTPNGGMYPR